MKYKILSVVLWIAVSLWLLMLLSGFDTKNAETDSKISYSELLDQLSTGAVAEVTVQDATIMGTRAEIS